MKAKKLIEDLQKIVGQYGDVEVDFVSSFIKCTCGPAEYCYCTSQDHYFSIEGVAKNYAPAKKNHMMGIHGISLQGERI